MPGEGLGCPLDLLRLACRSLRPLADDQPDRVHLRHRQATQQTHPGERFKACLPDDGLQADAIRFPECRLLNGSQLIPEVIRGVPFVDGIQVQEVAA